MVPYFKELDDPNNLTIKLIDKRASKAIDFRYLSQELAVRCAKIINELDELNPLHLTKEEEIQEFTNYFVDFDRNESADSILNDYDVSCPLDYYRYGEYDLYNELERGAKGFSSLGITYNGFNKMMELFKEFMSIHKDDELEFKCDIKDLALTFGDYLAFNRRMKYAEMGLLNFEIKEFILEDNWKAIDVKDKAAYYLDAIEQFFNLRKKILRNKYQIAEYIEYSTKILKGQNRLPKELEDRCKKCIEDIDNFKIQLPDKKVMIDMKVSNAFFITPHNSLYHVSTHKHSNIRDDYRLAMQEMNPTLEMLDPKYYFNRVKKYKEQGFITTSDYDYYFNLIYDCYILKNPNYESLDWLTKMEFDKFVGKVYDKALLNFAMGIESAKGSIWEFFYNLRLNANYYEMELFKIANMTLEDFLVRCVGFHKIESQVEKTITTSKINWEEEFSEYIKHGWKIEFIPPYVLEDCSLVEYNKDFIKIRNILKK